MSDSNNLGERVIINLSEAFGGPLMADPIGEGEYLLSRPDGTHLDNGKVRGGLALGVARMVNEGKEQEGYTLLRLQTQSLDL